MGKEMVHGLQIQVGSALNARALELMLMKCTRLIYLPGPRHPCIQLPHRCDFNALFPCLKALV